MLVNASLIRENKRPSDISIRPPDHAMIIRCSSFLIFFVLVQSTTTAIAEKIPSPQALAFFESKIRPVLAESCYECHSAKALAGGKLQGDLLLDSRDGVLKGGESGPAVVAKDVKSSLLIAAIRHESVEMPPKSKLPKSVIDDFVKWVEMGAPDPRDAAAPKIEKKDIDVAAGKTFWSFQPLKKPTPPKVANKAWIANDIDRYVLAKLESAGIAPNTPAKRMTLIRRLYFDVWGLPPTRANVETFVADQSDTAYESLVDRLLAGQHFGERWTRHWLDLARFAESNGYAFDKDRNAAFHFRDFVIKALNQDMPYDEFIRLQVAGDLIAPDDFMAQAATGFLSSGPFTSQQTQKERERSRYEQLDDVVATLGTSMLGLTIGCARCHDHKFDPIGHKDYYRFVSNFAEVGFQDYDWDPDPTGTKKALDKYNAAHKPFFDAKAKYTKDVLPAQLAAWEKRDVKTQPDPKLSSWYHAGPFTAADFNQAFRKKFAPEKAVDLKKPAGKLKWAEKTEWKDATIHNTFTGANAANYIYRTVDVPQAMSLEVSFGCDDGMKVFLNKKVILDKPTMGGVTPDQHIVTLHLNKGTNHLLLKVVNAGGPSGFYFKAKGVTTPKKIEDILKLAADKRNDAQKAELLKWFGPRDSEWSRLSQAEIEHATKKPQPKLTKIYAARKGGATYNFGADTRKVYFLARGNSNSKKGLASPAYLRVLMNSDSHEQEWLADTQAKNQAKKPTTKPPRVALGVWLTDAQHGAGNLLARVIVNRIWQHHFGIGIVATPSDFGQQGVRPTHPELLDFLAAKLIAGGWKVKPIHKLIMMSSVYRQSTDAVDSGLKHDPQNHLLWRRTPLRIEAEIIRDNLLAVSGSLDKTMFGAGSLDEGSARRSIYLKMKRGSLIPILQLFDAPDAIQSIGDRGVTTVPPQALTLMNSPLIRKMATQLAASIQKDHGTSPPEIVEATFWATLSRPPSSDEANEMGRFITEQASRYGAVDNAMNTAIIDYCQLMLCLNEFVYVD